MSIHAEFEDLLQEGFPPLLWQSSLVFGIPMAFYSALALYGMKTMGFSLYIRVYLHRVYERFFISKVRFCSEDSCFPSIIQGQGIRWSVTLTALRCNYL